MNTTLAYELATYILASKLYINNIVHYLAEIEIYYTDSLDHKDPYTHKDIMQTTMGKWYFHRTGKTYRSGTYKGMDITIGTISAYGGILIRSIAKEDGTVINGPCKCVDYILQLTQQPSIQELVLKNGVSIGSPLLRLEIERTQQAKIIASPRVGLSLNKVGTNNDVLLDYRWRPYRFTVCKYSGDIKKGMELSILYLRGQNYNRAHIMEAVQCTKAKLEGTLTHYKSGNPLTYIGSKLDKDLLDAYSAYLLK